MAFNVLKTHNIRLDIKKLYSNMGFSIIETFLPKEIESLLISEEKIVYINKTADSKRKNFLLLFEFLYYILFGVMISCFTHSITYNYNFSTEKNNIVYEKIINDFISDETIYDFIEEKKPESFVSLAYFLSDFLHLPINIILEKLYKLKIETTFERRENHFIG